ncbi:MAG: tetratricopeptide repeat protein [Planctomycetes bacterium]|nr:tetratricopeptide repeat protein [Planctomycetota bacterium]
MSEGCASEVQPAEGATPKGVRRSRVGKWRALVLLAVHVAIAAHVLHWQSTGSTLSPLEPSESMELSKNGIVNAGAIFLGLAIAATALFGRFFCGWACHLVAVQDACRWLLEKLGLRPRPVNLGLLGAVPWIVCVYMFFAPILYRVVSGLELGPLETKLSTNLFWATFPGWAMALTTFVVTSGLMVYLLGAKGFCTYGCPYGALFGIADQVAPLRVHVTDACSGCGHCTAVCTSNVRVHQEVRDWKAIVDPGCMKCLDCVSVCPKDALYVGFGAPAAVRSRARPKPARGATWAARAPRIASSAVFMWSCYVLLMFRGEEADFHLGFAALLALGSLVIALLFAGKSERPGAPSLGEDLILGVAFLVGLYAFRGYRLFPWLDATTPLLLAIGLGALVALATLTAWRSVGRSSLSLQTIEILRERRLTKPGWLMASLGVGLLALTAHATWSQVSSELASIEQRRLDQQRRDDVAGARAAYDRGVAHAAEARFSEAAAEFEAALALAPDFLQARENLAGMYCALGRFTDGIAQYELALAERPDDADTHFMLGRAYAALDQLDSALEHWSASVRLNPDHRPAHEMLAILYSQRGDELRAREHAEAARRDSGSGRR